MEGDINNNNKNEVEHCLNGVYKQWRKILILILIPVHKEFAEEMYIYRRRTEEKEKKSLKWTEKKEKNKQTAKTQHEY